MSIFIITGISGSGKSVALRALEDAGYDCVDNLPVSLLENLVETLQTSGSEHIAVAIDARRGPSIQEIPTMIAKLKKHRSVQLIFLNATNEALLKRFSETRRRHPLSAKNLDEQRFIKLPKAVDSRPDRKYPARINSFIRIIWF